MEIDNNQWFDIFRKSMPGARLPIQKGRSMYLQGFVDIPTLVKEIENASNSDRSDGDGPDGSECSKGELQETK